MTQSPDIGSIRIAGVVKQSIVDGPGLRMVVFSQGCPHHCPGCHNPDTHDFHGGYDCTVEALISQLDQNPLLRGITLSGGEPFCQAERLLPLIREARKRDKDVYCYTGYTFEELLTLSVEQPAVRTLLEGIDVLIDGRFDKAQRDLTLRFRGSRNQRILDARRSLEAGAAVEAVLPD